MHFVNGDLFPLWPRDRPLSGDGDNRCPSPLSSTADETTAVRAYGSLCMPPPTRPCLIVIHDCRPRDMTDYIGAWQYAINFCNRMSRPAHQACWFLSPGRTACPITGGGRFYKYRYIKNSVIRIVFIRLVFLSQYALVSGSVWMPVQVYIQSHYTQVFVTSRSVTVCIRRINAIAYRRHSTKWREGNNGEGTAGHISHSGCVLHWLLRVFCLWKLLIFCKRVCNFYFKNEVILK